MFLDLKERALGFDIRNNCVYSLRTYDTGVIVDQVIKPSTWHLQLYFTIFPIAR